MTRAWLSPAPVACDICRRAITNQFYDAKTRGGPWGILCPTCFRQHGRGLGTGLGQHYRRADANQPFQLQEPRK